MYPKFSNHLKSAFVTLLLGCPLSHAFDLDPLMRAIIRQDRELVFQLLRQYTLEKNNKNLSTYLGAPAGVQRLTELDHVAAVPDASIYVNNKYPMSCMTPLHLATGYSSAEIVVLLIRFGADPNVDIGLTPLLFACICNRLETAKVLLANGADINYRSSRAWDGNYPIHEAVRSKNTALAKLILDVNNGTVNVQNCYGSTPLHMVSTQPDMFDLLIHHGADINAVDESGQSVLCDSIVFGNPVIAAKIIGNNEFDWSHIHRRFDTLIGGNLLHIIARNISNFDNLELAVILLAHGLDPKVTDKANQTAARVALRWRNKAIYQLLEAATIAGGGPATLHYSSQYAEPLSLQAWSAHAIRRDTNLWESATALLPRHVLTFVFGTHWYCFRTAIDSQRGPLYSTTPPLLR